MLDLIGDGLVDGLFLADRVGDFPIDLEAAERWDMLPAEIDHDVERFAGKQVETLGEMIVDAQVAGRQRLAGEWLDDGGGGQSGAADLQVRPLHRQAVPCERPLQSFFQRKARGVAQFGNGEPRVRAGMAHVAGARLPVDGRNCHTFPLL